GLKIAQFSPDGSYALLRTYSLRTSKPVPQKQEIVLLDLRGNSTPRVLASSVSGDKDVTIDPWANAGATFLTHGQLSGMLLVVDWSSGKNVVTVEDPAHYDTPVLTASIDDSSPLVWANSLADSKGLILTGAS